MIKIAVLVSGGGTNLQALIDAQKAGAFPNGEIALVMASNQKAYALERAKNAGIESVVVSRKSFVDPADYDRAVVETLQSRGIELVVLAGFLSILGKPVIEAYPERILNIHPSLIPSFCGAGFYGLRVHQAALDYGVKVTGATVHLVNEIPDGGRILLQKAVEVLPGDTPEVLQRRVMEQAEWKLLPQAVAMLCEQLDAETGNYDFLYALERGKWDESDELVRISFGQRISRTWNRAGTVGRRTPYADWILYHGTQ